MTPFRERLKTWIKWYLTNAKMVWRALGAIVVLLLLLVAWRWWSQQSATPTQVSTPASQPATVTEFPSTVEYELTETGLVPTGLPVVYVVQPGDSTWKVAEAFYGAGQNYIDIESVNNLTPDQMLEVGQELLLPAVPVRQTVSVDSESSLTSEVTPAPSSEPSTNSESSANQSETQAAANYTVQSGDCLWCIAEAQYHQGTRWTEIYQLNRQVVGNNPDLIYPGQVLQLPE